MLYKWTCETLEKYPCVINDDETPGGRIRAEEAFSKFETAPGFIKIPASRFPLDQKQVKDADLYLIARNQQIKLRAILYFL